MYLLEHVCWLEHVPSLQKVDVSDTLLIMAEGSFTVHPVADSWERENTYLAIILY